MIQAWYISDIMHVIMLKCNDRSSWNCVLPIAGIYSPLFIMLSQNAAVTGKRPVLLRYNSTWKFLFLLTTGKFLVHGFLRTLYSELCDCNHFFSQHYVFCGEAQPQYCSVLQKQWGACSSSFMTPTSTSLPWVCPLSTDPWLHMSASVDCLSTSSLSSFS